MVYKDDVMKDIIIEEILNNGKKLSIEEIIERVIQYKAEIVEFTEPDPDDMLDVDEIEKVQCDTYLFKKYNEGISNNFSIDLDFYESYDNSLKILYKEKEILLGFSSFDNWGKNEPNNYYEFTFIMEVNTNKRLFVNHYGDYINYIKYLDEYDNEFDVEYKDYFSDKLIKWKEKTQLNLEKYELSDSEIEFLKSIYTEFGVRFDFALKDGYLCVTTRLDLENSYKANIIKIIYMFDIIFKLFERFMYV